MKNVKLKRTEKAPESKIFTTCYVIIKNDHRLNSETQEYDDYTQILRVCTNEKNANDYISFLRKNLLFGKNVSFYCIPTPYGDIELPNMK